MDNGIWEFEKYFSQLNTVPLRGTRGRRYFTRKGKIMVCMIADYREGGIDKHNEFIAPHTDDYEKAVHFLAEAMERQGLSVSCITVCPGAKDFDDLRRMADEGIKPGGVYIPYLFDLEVS